MVENASAAGIHPGLHWGRYGAPPDLVAELYKEGVGKGRGKGDEERGEEANRGSEGKRKEEKGRCPSFRS